MLTRARNWARTIKRDAHALYLAARDPRVAWHAKLFAACVAAYALSPIDFIPDFVPVLGYLDDIIIVPLGIMLVVRMIPAHIMPYAIAMKDRQPFGVAGIWENWKRPGTEDWMRTFCIITCPADALVAEIHDRMPVILPASAHDRWLACIEPDPRDVLVPYPPNLMTMWPISTRVNKPDNDDVSILDLDEQ